MGSSPKWRRYLRFFRPDPECDVDDELRTHLELRVADLVRRGMSAADAERQAVSEFGDVDATRTRLYEIGRRIARRQDRRAGLDAVRADLRYALRGLRASPLLTAVVVLTLGIGIGATTTMWGVMRQLVLRQPPHVAAPERVVKLFFSYEATADAQVVRTAIPPALLRAGTTDRASYSFFEAARIQDSAVYDIAAYISNQEIPLGQGMDAEVGRATMVSARFWSLVGVQPALGRLLSDEEAHPATGQRVAVVGHALWKRRFGGDRNVLGRMIEVRGVPYRIVGVAPRGFRGVELAETDLWLPLRAYGDSGGRAPTWHRTLVPIFQMVARVAPGVSLAAAEARASTLKSTFETRQTAEYFASRPGIRPRWGVEFGPVTGALGPDMKPIPEARVSVWLVGVASVLLAVACANVSGLLLLRALRRRREIAVRLALGMSRRRLAALLFTEGLVVAALGAIAGATGVAVGKPWVQSVLLPGMSTETSAIDWTLTGLAIGCTLGAAFAAGLAPLLQVRSDWTGGSLRDGGQHGAARRSRLFRTLLVAQTALSVVLLIGAGLFLRSIQRIDGLDHGMDVRHVLAVQADFIESERTPELRAAFFERALERVRSLPGVVRASLAADVPLRRASVATFRVAGSDDPVQPGGGVPLLNDVAGDFFAATGMRIIQGRDFAAADRTGPPTVVLNESLARFIWPDRPAVGECIYRTSEPERCVVVVGVVADARTLGRLREQQRAWFYLPLRLDNRDTRVLLVRVAPNVRGVESSLRRALQELDPAIPYVDIRRLGDALDPHVRPWRLGATLFTAFGALAALLAAIGLYAAVAYTVTERTREIGIRIAVGARARQVVGMVLRDGCGTALAGVLLGLGAGLALAPTIADLLFDVSPRDPLVLAVVGGGSLLTAFVASVSPARRAARIDPMAALRNE